MNKTYRLYEIAILSLVIALFASCDKFLDIRPTGKVIPTTQKEYRELLTQAYNSIPEDRGLTTFRTDEGVMDKAVSSITDIDSYFDIWSWEDEKPRGSTTSFGWRQYYNVLFIANYIIENRENIVGNEKQEISQLVGEAYALRGYMHFLLANLYGNAYTNSDPKTAKAIPLKLNSNTEETLSRNSVAEVYDSVEKDIAFAKQLMNVEKWEQKFKYRFSQKALSAFEVRFYLFKGDWAKSLEAAKSLIDAQLQLTDLNQTGSLLPNNFKSEENILAMEQNMTAQYIKAMKISPSLLKKYKSGDLRKSRYYKAITASIYVLQKGGSNEYRCTFRAGEVILSASEAAARLGENGLAKDYLFALTEKRYKKSAFESKKNEILAMDNDQLLAEIVAEREKELAFEGIRWFDLRRLSQPEIVKMSDEKKFVLQQNDQRYTIKIPAEAISANPKLNN